MAVKEYRAEDYGDEEVAMIKEYRLQLDDARDYFKGCIKPRLDRAYKLYIADRRDRSAEIKKWQANIFVPYVHAVVETLKPRILDARPEFSVQGRNEDDQLKALKVQQLLDYTWEIDKMDNLTEMVVDSCLIYGTGFIQVSWKKDVRTFDFLKTKDIATSKMKWEEKEVVFYDGPHAEWVDNYSLWYDWHNVDGKSKQFWFKRLLLTGAEIKRRYPAADKKKLEMALNKKNGDLTDYGSIRNEVRLDHEKIIKGADYVGSSSGGSSFSQIFNSTNDPDLCMYEVFEWWRPFADKYAIMVSDVPILKNGYLPNPYDFKESPFISIPYLKLPNEFEGYGIPLILESPQIMLNMLKNQRLDATTLNIHKMWIVNPLANINKEELVTRPFGIVYSTDPNGVREITFSDIKQSAYQEEDMLKSDMRYASGVDDFSMGAGGDAGSATEVRHLRESTLERVRLFINHLGDGFSDVLRYFLSMHRQFFTKDMTIRVIGEDGKQLYPLIEKDDLMGEFDLMATVVPSIAGMMDVKRKQDMDLFQLLMNLQFVDQKKLASKLLHDFNWSIDTITAEEQPQPMSPDGQPMAPGEEGMMPGGMPPGGEPAPEFGQSIPTSVIPSDIRDQVLAAFGEQAGGASPFGEASMPIDLLGGGVPPTAKGVPASNPAGLNRGGKVNTNIPLKDTSNPEASLQNRVNNIQR